MSQHGHLLTAGVVLAFVAAAGQGVARAQAGVDLSGTWVLNVEESDDLQAEYRRWLQARGVGGGAAGGQTPGTGAGDSSGSYDVAGGGPGALGAGGGLLGMMQRVTESSERLVIAQNEPEVTITNAAGIANMVFTDGRVVERVDESGGKTKVKTRWKKERMIVDIDFPSRPNPAGGLITPSLTMTYSLDKNGRLELASSVGIGAAVPPFSIERVYDREQPPG
jgi:hypothetical protein